MTVNRRLRGKGSISWCLAVLLFAAVCSAPPKPTGTYSLDITGAIRAHLDGQVTARASDLLDSSGESYEISLGLPLGGPFEDPDNHFAFLSFMTATRERPKPGHYRLVSPGAPRSAQTLTVIATSPAERPWGYVDGTLVLAKESRWSRELTGKFAVTLTRGRNVEPHDPHVDALVMTGHFQTQ